MNEMGDEKDLLYVLLTGSQVRQLREYVSAKIEKDDESGEETDEAVLLLHNALWSSLRFLGVLPKVEKPHAGFSEEG